MALGEGRYPSCTSPARRGTAFDRSPEQKAIAAQLRSVPRNRCSRKISAHHAAALSSPSSMPHAGGPLIVRHGHPGRIDPHMLRRQHDGRRMRHERARVPPDRRRGRAGFTSVSRVLA